MSDEYTVYGTYPAYGPTPQGGHPGGYPGWDGVHPGNPLPHDMPLGQFHPMGQMPMNGTGPFVPNGAGPFVPVDPMSHMSPMGYAQHMGPVGTDSLASGWDPTWDPTAELQQMLRNAQAAGAVDNGTVHRPVAAEGFFGSDGFGGAQHYPESMGYGDVAGPAEGVGSPGSLEFEEGFEDGDDPEGSTEEDEEVFETEPAPAVPRRRRPAAGRRKKRKWWSSPRGRRFVIAPALSFLIAVLAAVLVSMVSVFGGLVALEPLRNVAAARTAPGLIGWWPLLVYGPWTVASLSILRAALHRRRALHSWLVVLLFTGVATVLCVTQAPRTLPDIAAAALPSLAALTCFHQLVRLITLVRPPLPTPSARHRGRVLRRQGRCMVELSETELRKGKFQVYMGPQESQSAGDSGSGEKAGCTGASGAAGSLGNARNAEPTVNAVSAENAENTAQEAGEARRGGGRPAGPESVVVGAAEVVREPVSPVGRTARQAHAGQAVPASAVRVHQVHRVTPAEGKVTVGSDRWVSRR